MNLRKIHITFCSDTKKIVTIMNDFKFCDLTNEVCILCTFLPLFLKVLCVSLIMVLRGAEIYRYAIINIQFFRFRIRMLIWMEVYLEQI
jgi:hypothetical protein